VEFERTTGRPAISCTALFALFDSWSRCRVERRLRLVRAAVGIAGVGKTGNHIRPMLGILLLLWLESRRCRSSVVVISSSGYFFCGSVVRVAWHHDDSLGGGVASRCTCSGAIYFSRTSAMTCHHLLLAPKPAPQATCQKCRRHGG
jgi:hypothetical protein